MAATGKDTFGPRLRAQRERTGISLDDIAQSTKIQKALLAGLENNDVSHWPIGIYRRAFFRDYLVAIGVQSEAVVSEFVRLFPEPGEAALARVPVTVDDVDVDFGPVELRLVLAPVRFSMTRRLLLQTLAAVLDLSAIGIITVWAVLLFPIQVTQTLAMTGLVYYGLSAAWLGRTPALWWFFKDRRRSKRDEPVEVSETPTLRIVSRQPEERIAVELDDSEEPIAVQRRAM